MSQAIGLPDYRSIHFVNRRAELEIIIFHIDELLAVHRVRGTRQVRTFIIQGEHGMGKSWLLAHLVHKFENDGQIFYFSIDLENYRNEKPPEERVKAIWHELYSQLFGQPLEQSISLEQLTHQLIKKLRETILQKRPLILLIDSVYEAERELLTSLEEYFLAPLIVEANVILVMAGRGRPYTWVSPELRLRARFIKLEPFDIPDAENQLTLQLPDTKVEIDHIYNIGQGNPKVTYLIGKTGQDIDAINQVIDDMLAYIPTEERISIRESAQALCLPNWFDLQLASDLLDAYLPGKRPRQRREVLAEMNALFTAGLVEWNTEQGAYTFHPSTHNLLRQYMEQSQTEHAIDLHKVALIFYQAWVDSEPPNPKRWEREVEYHRQRIESLQNKL